MAGLLTVLYLLFEVGLFISIPVGSELEFHVQLQGFIIRVALGVVTTFLICWVVVAGVIGLGRALGVAAAVTTVLLAAFAIYALASWGGSTQSPAPPATPTVTPQPTATSVPTTPTPIGGLLSQWRECIVGSRISQEYYNDHLLQRTCIYGVITQKGETSTGAVLYTILPTGTPVSSRFFFIILVPDKSALNQAFPGALGILTQADVGECIIAIGYPSRYGNENCFLGAEVVDLPLLTEALGATDPTVGEVRALCK